MGPRQLEKIHRNGKDCQLFWRIKTLIRHWLTFGTKKTKKKEKSLRNQMLAPSRRGKKKAIDLGSLFNVGQLEKRSHPENLGRKRTTHVGKGGRGG